MVSLVALLSIAASIVVADNSDDIKFPETEVAVDSNGLPRPDLSLDVHFPVDSKIIDTSAAPCVVTLVKNHTYANSLGKPYKGDFSPPSCYDDPDYSLVYLRYKAKVDPGRQYDRIAGVWIGNHAVLRTTTQEPSKELGPHWEIFREISQYRALFGNNGTVTASLGNVVNDVYTSSFHVTITAEFYKKDPSQHVVQRVPYAPDQIIPIFNSGSTLPWFNVQPDTLGKNFNLVTFPKNLDGLYLELFTSHHGCDEFQFNNPPDIFKGSYGKCQGGSFREVQILLDNEIVGAVWPFPLIHSGGLLPALWYPIVSIGTFEAPTYTIDLTPYLAIVLDGKPHNVSFAVGHGLAYWPINANLLVYQDHNVEKTVATLDRKVFDRNVVPNVAVRNFFNSQTVRTKATRQVNVESTITNSQGIRKYNLQQKFNFVNREEFTLRGQSFKVRSTTQTKTTIEFQDGTTTTKYYTEDYPLNGAKWPSDNRANALVERDLRQKLRIDGNKDHFRVGVDGYELTIAQKAKAKSGSTSFNQVALAASNSTGCYSLNVRSDSGIYTEYVEAETCPNVNQYVGDYSDDGDDLPNTLE
ncbi:hypothetical protein DYB31_013924 [Aphanomyces astaci]|uniref:Peptide N-acetyl-beta-D-glucosaminyl asparaginase amidase A N-terminal domain-containing protein n=1 Tax=Aphanomyces astaci TaxID=112090 RepID=A0A397EWA5_APHAT|nr:hypothetical protein DYB31_013924 [Aphanomyces astaci]